MRVAYLERLVEGAQGVRLAVRDYGGSGSPIVLTHGLGGNLHHVEILVPFLIGRHRLVAFDLRGHGHSEVGPFEPEIAVSDLEAVVSAFSMSRPAVIGHSLGGVVATLHASRNRTRAVVNIDGGSSLRKQ